MDCRRGTRDAKHNLTRETLLTDYCTETTRRKWYLVLGIRLSEMGHIVTCYKSHCVNTKYPKMPLFNIFLQIVGPR